MKQGLLIYSLNVLAQYLINNLIGEHNLTGDLFEGMA